MEKLFKKVYPSKLSSLHLEFLTIVYLFFSHFLYLLLFLDL